MKVALLSPYDGGSHRSWSSGLLRHCTADVECFSLPARFWKWRMHGAALTLARRFPERPDFDLINMSSYFDLVLQFTN